MTLSGPGGVASSRLIAFDGHDVPAGMPLRAMRFPTGPGHTSDFTFTPTVPGDYTFTAQRIVTASATLATSGAVTSVPIRVREP
jgi:hypothetical protein